MATPPKKSNTSRVRSTGPRGTATRRTAASNASSDGRKRPARASARKNNNHFSTALIVGAVAAVGAIATGALLALRGSSAADFAIDWIRRDGDDDGESAHQPDGEDSSVSFNAGIADENTIPERISA